MIDSFKKITHILKNIISQKTTAIMVLVFLFIRILSFTTVSFPLFNQFIAGASILSFFFICKKNLGNGFLFLILEFLLDGAGHFFELHGLLLRTWFLGIFGLFWTVDQWKNQSWKEVLTRKQFFLFCSVIGVIVFSTLRGFFFHHDANNILQDAIVYFFLFLLFPAVQFQAHIKKYIPHITEAFFIGSAFFSLSSFVWYSSFLGVLRDPLYHWFRNVAGGKITDMGDQFFRIVLPEHLYLVPLFLIFTSLLLATPQKKKYWFYILLCSILLALNFSRIYFVALAAGMLVLFVKNNVKRTIFVSAGVTLSVLLCFSMLYAGASRGKSLGLELIGLRIGGATSPRAETSGAIRMAILPDALSTIKQHPLLGSGLATTVTYIDPASQLPVTRTQFDWGYLEMLAELGIIGTVTYLFFLISILVSLFKIAYQKNSSHNEHTLLLRGLFAGGISLFVINITTPALFHGFGILYFILLFVVVQTKKGEISSKL
jgi:O-antigen ligase